jgi:hypothetical protein
VRVRVRAHRPLFPCLLCRPGPTPPSGLCSCGRPNLQARREARSCSPGIRLGWRLVVLLQNQTPPPPLSRCLRGSCLVVSTQKEGHSGGAGERRLVWRPRFENLGPTGHPYIVVYHKVMFFPPSPLSCAGGSLRHPALDWPGGGSTAPRRAAALPPGTRGTPEAAKRTPGLSSPRISPGLNFPRV